MWQIRRRDAQGESHEIDFDEIDHPTRQGIPEAVREITRAPVPDRLRRELESPDPLPGIEGIENWGSTAADLVGRDLLWYSSSIPHPENKRIPALSFRGLDPTPTAVHEPEALIANVSGMRTLEISADHSFHKFFPIPSTSILEARLYSDNAVLETEAESDLEKPSFLPPLPANQQTLIARVAHLISTPFRSDGDRFMQGRLRHYENRYSVIARAYPDIALAATYNGQFRAIQKAAEGTPVIVFVHGTYSCAIPHLALLHPLSLPAYRFEHDTFLPVRENSERLIQAINDYVPKAARLYLIAHSRGGLVSRLAARQLCRSYEVHVMTYGTPHNGTPLANAGRRVLTALLASGRAVLLSTGSMAASAVFSWDPPSLAGKLLLRGILPSAFPPGLDAMRTDSELIGALVSVKEPFLFQTWGAKCEINKLASGAFGYISREALEGVFGGLPNDTVVGVASAIGADMRRAVLDRCTHFQYFSETAVRNHIQSLR